MEKPPPKRILVVDDESPVREICQRMLAPRGYVVDTAANGNEALERINSQTYDLVLTDYRMPGELNGLALGHAIKARFPQSRIILMTAFPAVDTAVETLRLGAMDYLIKPFEQAELIRRVESCFPKTATP
jgi:DNA-binding NtrC family response regulator